MELTIGEDIFTYFLDIINFIIVFICLYLSINLLFYIKDKFERYFQIALIGICILYSFLLIRHYLYEVIFWDLDVILWTIFEASIFILLIVRNIHVRSKIRESIK